MPYAVRFLPAAARCETEPGESLLHAALRAGLNVDHGCTNGSCGHCKARLVSGETHQFRHHDFILNDTERAAGQLLMCCHSAASDVSLEASLAVDGSDIPEQQLVTRIRRLDRFDEDTLRLQLRTPRASTLRFMAGQHVRLQIDNGLQREYPLASCPCDGLNLEFHLHRDASDAFTDFIFQQAMKNMRIEVIGPVGDFTLVEKDPAPILFIAWGTGFAPIHSLLEHCLSLEFSQPIVFHWVVHEHERHYMDGYCRSVADAIDNFNYYPLHAETADAAITAILAQHDDLAGWRSYIAAPPAIIERATAQLVARGLEPAKTKSDPLVA